jgi:hypothetical protein
MIRIRSTELALFALLALAVPQAQAQADKLPMSRTAGTVTLDLPTGKTTLVGLANVRIVASGTLTGFGDAEGEVVVTSSPAVLPDVTGTPHALKIVSRANPAGNNAYGHSTRITSQSGQELTVETPESLPEPNIGDEFVIYQLSTLASVLGAANEVGLTGADSANAADKVYLTEGGVLVGYFFRTGVNQWRRIDDADGANQAGTVIAPGSGLMIVRVAGGSDRSLRLSGETLPARHVASVTVGQNIVNNPFLVPTSLSASDIQSNITGGTGPGVADIVYLEQDGVLTGYYFKTGGPGGTGWRALGDSITDAGSAELMPAKAILFKEQAGSAGFALPEPFAD